jgi:hypothetical protein
LRPATSDSVSRSIFHPSNSELAEGAVLWTGVKHCLVTSVQRLLRRAAASYVPGAGQAYLPARNKTVRYLERKP